MWTEAYALTAEASTTMRKLGSSNRGTARSTARSGKKSGDAETETQFLEERVMDELERQHPEGLTLAQVIETFASRGMHLSEATFRKYVQYGLLGRSRRVGRKGKHQGSLGLYPATTVRRVNAIKQMMGANYTIEDIQRSFLRFTDEIEGLRRGMDKLLSGFDGELARGSFPADRRRVLLREIAGVRKAADEVLSRVESLERQLVSPLERAARERAFGSGAKGGTDELL
jgi:hypothetical protein